MHEPDYHHRPSAPPIVGDERYQRVMNGTAPVDDERTPPPRQFGKGVRAGLAAAALLAAGTGAHAAGLVDIPGLPDPRDTVEVAVDVPGADEAEPSESNEEPAPSPLPDFRSPLDQLPPLSDLDDLPLPPELRDLFDQLGGGQFDPGEFDRFLEENFDPQRLEELFGDPEALQAEIDGLLEQLGVDPTLLEELFSQFSDLGPPGG